MSHTHRHNMLPPPGDPDAPGFWMFEESGVLAPVVQAYLAGSTLDQNQVKIMKAYLWQWVKSPAWIPDEDIEALRVGVMAIQTQEDIDVAIAAAIRLHMDPL